MTSALAAGGLVGPLAFIGAWAVGGTVLSGREYSSMDDAISQLAAVGMDTRPLMTAGFVVFGMAVPVYGRALRQAGFAGAGRAAVVTGLATLGVAVFPVGDATGTAHGICAALGYVSLAAVPGLAAPVLIERGRRRAARTSLAAAVAVAISLAATVVVEDANGLFQRLGLTIGDVWLMASAWSLLRRR